MVGLAFPMLIVGGKLAGGAIKMPSRPTLKELARLAGVSTSTASLVMRDSPLVAEATRQRVLTTAGMLGYVCRPQCRQPSDTSISYHRARRVRHHQSLLCEFTAGIEAACERSGWVTFLCNSAESLQRQEIFLRRMHEQNVEGIIISPAAGTSPANIRALHDAGLPCVQALRYLRGMNLDFAGVDSPSGGWRRQPNTSSPWGIARIAFVGGGWEHIGDA